MGCFPEPKFTNWRLQDTVNSNAGKKTWSRVLQTFKFVCLYVCFGASSSNAQGLLPALLLRITPDGLSISYIWNLGTNLVRSKEANSLLTELCSCLSNFFTNNRWWNYCFYNISNIFTVIWIEIPVYYLLHKYFIKIVWNRYLCNKQVNTQGKFLYEIVTPFVIL